jgi:hypothetical protein
MIGSWVVFHEGLGRGAGFGVVESADSLAYVVKVNSGGRVWSGQTQRVLLEDVTPCTDKDDARALWRSMIA